MHHIYDDYGTLECEMNCFLRNITLICACHFKSNQFKVSRDFFSSESEESIFSLRDKLLRKDFFLCRKAEEISYYALVGIQIYAITINSLCMCNGFYSAFRCVQLDLISQQKMNIVKKKSMLSLCDRIIRFFSI
jgi:hypothetical protein